MRDQYSDFTALKSPQRLIGNNSLKYKVGKTDMINDHVLPTSRKEKQRKDLFDRGEGALCSGDESRKSL